MGTSEREGEHRHDSPDEGKRREVYQKGNDSGNQNPEAYGYKTMGNRVFMVYYG